MSNLNVIKPSYSSVLNILRLLYVHLGKRRKADTANKLLERSITDKLGGYIETNLATF